MYDIKAKPYVCCYKCNEAFNVKFMSSLSDHLKSQRHCNASNIWYTLGNTIPPNAFFPDPSSVVEVIKPNEQLVEDKFLADGRLHIAKDNTIKKVKRGHIYNMFNDLVNMSADREQLRTLYPAQEKFLKLVYQFCVENKNMWTTKQKNQLMNIPFADSATNFTENDRLSINTVKNKANTPEVKVAKLEEDEFKTGSLYDKRKIDMHNYIKENGSLGVSGYVKRFAQVCDEISEGKYREMTFENAIKKYNNEHLAQMKESTANAYISTINYYFRNVINRTDFSLKMRAVGSQSRPMLTPDDCSETQMKKFCEQLKEKNKIIGDIVLIARWTGLRMREIVLLESSKCKIAKVGKKGEPLHKLEFEIHGKRHKFAKSVCYVEQVIEVIQRNKKLNSSKFLLFPQLDDLDEDNLLIEAAKIGKKYGDQVAYHTQRFWGIPNIGPHAFRRTFAATAYENGMELATISKMLRHQSIKDSVKYVGDLTMQKEVDGYLKKLANPLTGISKMEKQRLYSEFQANFEEDDERDDDEKKAHKTRKLKNREERKSEVSEEDDEMEIMEPIKTVSRGKKTTKTTKRSKTPKSRSKTPKTFANKNPETSDMEID